MSDNQYRELLRQKTERIKALEAQLAIQQPLATEGFNSWETKYHALHSRYETCCKQLDLSYQKIDSLELTVQDYHQRLQEKQKPCDCAPIIADLKRDLALKDQQLQELRAKLEAGLTALQEVAQHWL